MHIRNKINTMSNVPPERNLGLPSNACMSRIIDLVLPNDFLLRRDWIRRNLSIWGLNAEISASVSQVHSSWVSSFHFTKYSIPSSPFLQNVGSFLLFFDQTKFWKHFELKKADKLDHLVAIILSTAVHSGRIAAHSSSNLSTDSKCRWKVFSLCFSRG